jgi:hypothetical protein
MDIIFPIFSCVLVITVYICCRLRHHRQGQFESQEPVYVILPPPSFQPQPSAPPMTTIYEDDPAV